MKWASRLTCFIIGHNQEYHDSQHWYDINMKALSIKIGLCKRCGEMRKMHE